MKKLLIIFIALSIHLYSANAEEAKCNTALSKLSTKCNFIGKGVEKLKKFSEKNKTLDQSYKNIKLTIEKKIKKN